MKKNGYLILLFIAFSACNKIIPLDVSVQTKSNRVSGREILIIKNTSSNAWNNVLVTIKSSSTKGEYFYHIDLIKAKEKIEIKASHFEDENGTQFDDRDESIGNIKINCDQGWWENDEK